MVYIYTGLDTIRFFHFTLPIPIFKKKIFPDPIIDQILDQNYDQIPIIDPIKKKRHLPKKKHFLQVISFIPLCENEQHIKVYYIFLLILRKTNCPTWLVATEWYQQVFDH
jgi:hypothetical protein